MRMLQQPLSTTTPTSMRTISAAAWLLILALQAAPVHAQDAAELRLDAQHQAIEALRFLEGHWLGEGWMQRGPNRETFVSEETVSVELGGLLLLIEGRHVEADSLADVPDVVHHAMAMVTYEPDEAQYHFRTYTKAGRGGNFTGSVPAPNTFVWTMEAPGRTIRYTITLDDHGRWSELGEMSGDGGSTWMPFFGMTLERSEDES